MLSELQKHVDIYFISIRKNHIILAGSIEVIYVNKYIIIAHTYSNIHIYSNTGFARQAFM
jgi:hypothetical protein